MPVLFWILIGMLAFAGVVFILMMLFLIGGNDND